MANSEAVAEAVKAVLDAVQGADAQEMVGRRPKPKLELEVEGAPGEECEDCKTGTCTEHMDESALADLMREE